VSPNEPNTEVVAGLDATSDTGLSDNIERDSETENEIETGEIGTQDFEGQRESSPRPGDTTDEPAEARPA
jgi:hypothetical protein